MFQEIGKEFFASENVPEKFSEVQEFYALISSRHENPPWDQPYDIFSKWLRALPLKKKIAKLWSPG